MRLITLGKLALQDNGGPSFSQKKPLFLLAYLLFEGRQPRKRVAELFWPSGKDPANNLSRLLKELRKLSPEPFWSDTYFLEANVDSDLSDFLAAVRNKQYERAAQLYQGPFLAGNRFNKSNSELEEWLFSKQELIAHQAQEAFLGLAEREASKGAFTNAARLAETAHTMMVTDIEPETLSRMYVFLVAGGSPFASQVRQEAESFGVQLHSSKAAARSSLQRHFVGREKEIKRLEQLKPGEVAWVRGSQGMGKTALLESLPGVYLAARSGLPYATLEPLLDAESLSNDATLINTLTQRQERWLFDDWEEIDAESRGVLERLSSLTEACIVIAGRSAPPFKVDVQLDLKPFSAAELASYTGVWEATEGLPSLVGAYLREEPLEEALRAQLEALAEHAKEVYLALTLVEQDLILVRRALGLSAADMAMVLEQLQAMGLVTATGKLRANRVARDALDHVNEDARLALKLARQLEDKEAFPLYQKAKLFWEDSDLEAVCRAYLAWAKELLKRGKAQRASEILRDAPKRDDVSFLRAQALETAGEYREALSIAETLIQTPNTEALKSALYWRLGRNEEAEVAAKQALEGDMAARALAFNTLGNLARTRADYKSSIALTRKAAALWQVLGKKEDWGGALNNIAITLVLANKDSSEVFKEAFGAAKGNPIMKARVLISQGFMYEKEEALEEAKNSYKEAAQLAQTAGGLDQAAMALNNLGVLHHKEENSDRARTSYMDALELARQAGQRLTLGMAMANLAELNEDKDAWDEALFQLRDAGHEALAREYQEDFASFWNALDEQKQDANGQSDKS